MNHLRKVLSVLSTLSIVTITGLVSGCSVAASESEAALGETQAALSASECPAGVPAAINPGADQTLKSKVDAIGVQIYTCTAKPDGSYAWAPIGPQANLYNEEGRMIGTHFIGPTWQGNDESSVVAAKAAGASVDATAVPWLLLNAVSHGAQEGRFSDVTQIQRLSTVGGNPPSTACGATNVSTLVQSPYSAEYFFYKTKTQGTMNQCSG